MVAEALGAAVLTVSVDDRQLRSGLLAVQNEAQRTAQQVQAAFARLGGEIRLPNLQNLSARIAVDSSQLDRSLQTAEQLRRVLDEISQQRLPGAGGAGGLGPKPPLPPPIPPELLRGLAEARQRSDGLTEAGRAMTRQAQDQVQALNRIGAAAGAAGQGFDALTGVLGRLGLATSVAGVAAFVGNQIKQLDDASAAVRTLGVDGDELKERMRLLSVELGNNVSQVELAKAAYDVASSGFASAADATEVLRAAALGAKGGFSEIDDVARGLTGVLNAYGLSVTESTRIVDQFAQTQNDGVITIRQYVNEIGNVASIAAAAGIPLEELNAAIATATLRGVPVSQTFTGLRQAISSILKPSEQAANLARALGIDFSVTALQAKGFAGLLADIQAKGGGTADRLAVLLGSVEAQAAVQPLLNDRLAKYNDLLGNQANGAGTAGRAMEINSKTISGGLSQIGNGFVNLATTLDTTLKPIFNGLIGSLNLLLQKLNQVSALAPDKVKAREQQASDIVSSQLGLFGGAGFEGDIAFRYNGKNYVGSAQDTRNKLVADLLAREVSALSRGVTAPEIKEPPRRLPVLDQDAIRERYDKAQSVIDASVGAFDVRASGFFGGLTIKYGGKVYKGSATGIREMIVADLFKQDLAKFPERPEVLSVPSKPGSGKPGGDKPPGGTGGANADPAVDKAKQAADIAEIRTKNDLELKGIQVRIAAARQLERLDGLDKQRLESELALNEKILAVKTIQADIQRELAKPVGNGITNIEGSRSAVRLEQLQGQQRKAVLELRQAYEQAGRDLVRAAREAAAVTRRALDVFRSGGDTLQELGRRGADAITGARSPIDVRSPEDALREGRRRVAAQVQDLGNGISDAARDAVRAAEALRDANQRRAGGELIPLDQLAKFKTDADSAAAKLTVASLEVGRALKDGATEAAKQLRDAQGNYNDVVRGGFEFFTSRFQQEQLALARREFQPLIERGVFRRDVPTQTPEQVFALASLARQFLQAENQVALAQAQKNAADAALRNAGALVENSTKMGLLSDSLIKLATKEWMVNVNVQPPMAALPGV